MIIGHNMFLSVILQVPHVQSLKFKYENKNFHFVKPYQRIWKELSLRVLIGIETVTELF